MKNAYNLLLLFSCLFISMILCSCNSSESDRINTGDSSTYEDVVVEATSTLASYIRIEAGSFEWSSQTPSVLYGKITVDNDFGKSLLEEYSQLQGMEYVIVFDSDMNPVTTFIYQPNEAKESIAASGEIKHIDEINVSTWDELLDHYDINK
ncbi:MAG: hypothetical protein GXY08_01790 [Ruminococcus sp.]|nr:hypothetical protein [Ruminococcus sp.]